MKICHSLFALLLLNPGQAAAVPPADVAIMDTGAPAGPGSSAPSIATGHGRVILSWLEPGPVKGMTSLRFAVYSAGKWSEPRTIVQRPDFFVNWADVPSVIEDAEGTLFAHWLQKSGGDVYAYDVRMAISRDGGRSWSGSLLLNDDGRKGEHGFVTLAPLSTGGVGATWLDGRNMVEGKEEGDMTLRYATVDATGAVRAGVQLDDRTCECCTTGMTMVKGKPLIVYRDRSADEVRDIAVVRQTARGWSRPAVLRGDGWKIAGCPVNGPQVDAWGGTVAVAWFTAASGTGHVHVAFSEDGGLSFGKRVTADDGLAAGRVDVVMLDADTAMVTWLEQTAAGAEIRGRRVKRSGRADRSVKIADSSAARSAGVPRITRMDRDVFVAWTAQVGTGQRVRVGRQRF